MDIPSITEVSAKYRMMSADLFSVNFLYRSTRDPRVQAGISELRNEFGGLLSSSIFRDRLRFSPLVCFADHAIDVEGLVHVQEIVVGDPGREIDTGDRRAATEIVEVVPETGVDEAEAVARIGIPVRHGTALTWYVLWLHKKSIRIAELRA